jgi:signal transduction histidine kinase
MFTVNIPDLPHIMGDRSRIRQIMTNLISNSIKFTNRGTIDVKAEVTENNRLLVQVSDTGRGMDREELDNIFNPYRRSKHDTVGLGIGLALSKIFVELHQGSIQAESSQGEGSTFSFTLPIQSRLNIN